MKWGQRKELSPRRGTETYAFAMKSGGKFVASVSVFADNGQPGELFLNTEMKQGSGADINAADGAVAVSLALQYGCPVEDLRKAMKRDENGDPQGPLGKALDLIGGGVS